MNELTLDALKKIPHGDFISDEILTRICRHYAPFYIRYVKTLEEYVEHVHFYDAEKMEVYDFCSYLKYELDEYDLSVVAGYLLEIVGIKLVPTQFVFAFEEKEGTETVSLDENADLLPKQQAGNND